jgi:hypothetical protein
MTRIPLTFDMQRHLLITLLVLALLPSCKSGDRARPGDSSPLPPDNGNLHESRADASVSASSGRDAGSEPPAEQPGPIRDAAVPREEIDNTLYWDAATRPTSDHVRDVDAGEPER